MKAFNFVRTGIVCAFSLSMAGARAGGIEDLQAPIPKFFEVAPGIYRGGRPGLEGMHYLHRQGIGIVLNLENNRRQVEKERIVAAELRLDFVSSPMNALRTPRDRQIDPILALLADPNRPPLFVHCREGVDRTGLIVALHRVLHEGWDPQVAYREWVDRGYHTIFWKLRKYFERRTGSDVFDGFAPSPFQDLFEVP